VTRHRTLPQPARSPDAGREERHRLDQALRAAALDTGDLDGARTCLISRLSLHSDDYSATAALQALNTFTAGQRTDDGSGASAHLRVAGLSFVERMRGRTRANGTS
jgi:hypothetical protein